MKASASKPIRNLSGSRPRRFRPLPSLSSLAHLPRTEQPGVTVPLPKNLLPIHVEKAVGYIEREASELIDIYLEQANVFSAIIGILGIKGLDSFSPYKKHKHPD